VLFGYILYRMHPTIGRNVQFGDLRQQTFTVRGSKKDAERELRAILTRIEGGAYIKPTKLTVGEFLTQWMENYVLTNTSPRTTEGYRVIIQRHLMPNLGIIPLTQLQPSHIQGYYAKALSEGKPTADGRAISGGNVSKWLAILPASG